MMVDPHPETASSHTVRRLTVLVGHVIGTPPPAAAPVPVATSAVDVLGDEGGRQMSQLPDGRATGLYSTPRLLSNQQMATFLGTGFLALPVDDVPGEVHHALHNNAQRKWDQSGQDNGAGLGNNIWPAVPQLGEVLRSAVVHGGIQSILGEGYTMNPHRHMQYVYTSNPPAFVKNKRWIFVDLL